MRRHGKSDQLTRLDAEPTLFVLQAVLERESTVCFVIRIVERPRIGRNPIARTSMAQRDRRYAR